MAVSGVTAHAFVEVVPTARHLPSPSAERLLPSQPCRPAKIAPGFDSHVDGGADGAAALAVVASVSTLFACRRAGRSRAAQKRRPGSERTSVALRAADTATADVSVAAASTNQTQAPSPDEAAVLDAIYEGVDEASILDKVGALESKGMAAKGLDQLLGAWDLVWVSTSKFDFGAPLGRRVDGTSPGLEGMFPAAAAGEEASVPASSSPVQRFVTGLFPSQQVIKPGQVDTVVDLAGAGRLTLEASTEDMNGQSRLNFTFERGYFQFGEVKVPYPVPFQLLGDEAKGWIDSTYCSTTLRIARGNKGSVFVLKKRFPLDIVILPGLGNDSGDYTDLIRLLAKDGHTAAVVPVVRPDWLRNALGLLDSSYWEGTLQPRPVLDWYLDRLAALIDGKDRPVSENGVILLGHSAGGWLGRIVLGESQGRGVRRLVTLGTPHCPPLAGSDAFDQTRGLLTYVQTQYQTLPSSVEGISVIGRYMEGTEEVFTDLPAFVVGLGYKQVHGRADVMGDGIIPQPSAEMDGMKIVELEGVYHSPLGADVDRKWYGDAEIYDKWSIHLK
eukprot:TRINITY_DN110982_c0_g1_i1.p1 TRINITY_DN110982_c0_g1~~TRINITY_DN110982_c0_g1_i1.p1  ORF type:complete len:576 (+),score=94.46 TRINITY_DN110982_c0_g1_i1:59-1729(+)